MPEPAQDAQAIYGSADEDQSGTIFRDVIMLALAGFIVMVILLLPHLNPPGKEAQADIKTPGNLVVEIRWPDEIDADVDLWVQAPGDIPVGYSNKSGEHFNLLRDDLGWRSDPLGLNTEIAFSRGLPAGPYTINLHMYNTHDGVFPIPVTVVVSVKENEKASARAILTRQVELSGRGEEVTVFRFRLDDDGKLEKGSVHSLFRPLFKRKEIAR